MLSCHFFCLFLYSILFLVLFHIWFVVVLAVVAVVFLIVFLWTLNEHIYVIERFLFGNRAKNAQEKKPTVLECFSVSAVFFIYLNCNIDRIDVYNYKIEKAITTTTKSDFLFLFTFFSLFVYFKWNETNTNEWITFLWPHGPSSFPYSIIISNIYTSLPSTTGYWREYVGTKEI